MQPSVALCTCTTSTTSTTRARTTRSVGDYALPFALGSAQPTSARTMKLAGVDRMVELTTT